MGGAGRLPPKRGGTCQRIYLSVASGLVGGVAARSVARGYRVAPSQRAALCSLRVIFSRFHDCMFDWGKCKYRDKCFKGKLNFYRMHRISAC